VTYQAIRHSSSIATLFACSLYVILWVYLSTVQGELPDRARAFTYHTEKGAMLNRLMLHAVNEFSVVKYNKFLHSCNKLARIGKQANVAFD
jgi:hypothetical protein